VTPHFALYVTFRCRTIINYLKGEGKPVTRAVIASLVYAATIGGSDEQVDSIIAVGYPSFPPWEVSYSEYPQFLDRMKRKEEDDLFSWVGCSGDTVIMEYCPESREL
jgi:hypothetical protein